jgi:hypothetical protein
MTMHHIASVTLASTGTFFFTNIPDTFDHLQIRVSARSATNGPWGNLYHNWYGATAASTFSSHWLTGDGASATASNLMANPYVFSGPMFAGAQATANTYGVCIIDILDYKNTNKFKTVKVIGGNDRNGSGQVTLASGLIQFSGVITGGFIDTESTFVAGSTADVYGINSNPISRGV